MCGFMLLKSYPEIFTTV